MDEFEVIQDYSIIDAFINQNLADFNRKLFGNRDEHTGYFDEVDMEDETDNNVVIPDETEYEQPTEEYSSDEMMEDDAYNFVFDGEGGIFTGPTTGPGHGGGGGGGGKTKSTLGENIAAIESGGKYSATNKNSSATGKYQFLWGDWGKSIMKVTGVKSQKEFLDSPTAQEKYYSFYEKTYLLPEVQKIRKEIKTALTDMQLAKLVHFRGEGGARKYLKGELKDKPESYNIPISKYIKQSGGNVAVTPEQQYLGLNDSSIDNLFIPLQGTNPIRGLDNGQPVYVRDETGNETVLHGADDVAYMTGGVHEKRLSKKYKTQAGGSIVDLLNSHGIDGSYANRKRLFNDYFAGNYSGTAEQNTRLFREINAGKLQVPGYGAAKVVKKDANKSKLESGVVVDKRTNQGYVIRNGKVQKQFPVLTGKNTEGNYNKYSMQQLEANPDFRNTPMGAYYLNPADNIYGIPGFDMSPLNYEGSSPEAFALAMHTTYDPKVRSKYYNTTNANQSFGCINCRKQDMQYVNQQFPKGDTLMVIDSKKGQSLKNLGITK